MVNKLVAAKSSLEDRQRTTAELWRALDEVKLWRYGVAKGLVKPEQANLCIESAKRVVNLKRAVPVNIAVSRCGA